MEKADATTITGAQKSLATFFSQILFRPHALSREERVEIRGLCSFYVKKYKIYTGRNPKTGEKLTIKSKKLPFFKCGKNLKDRVNKGKSS